MGTRNLTLVVKDNEIKIAQYGQWDGYPDGQGRTVHKFISTVDFDRFAKQVDRVKFAGEGVRGTKALEKRVNKAFKKMNDEMTKRKCYSAKEMINDVFGTIEKFEYQCNTRDTCAEILEVILNAPGKGQILLVDETAFAGDSLFCEWAYLINLDTKELEVYTGFNKNPLHKRDRFYYLSAGPKNPNNDYTPITLLKTYDMNNMPTEDDYVNELDKLEGKE